MQIKLVLEVDTDGGDQLAALLAGFSALLQMQQTVLQRQQTIRETPGAWHVVAVADVSPVSPAALPALTAEPTIAPTQIVAVTDLPDVTSPIAIIVAGDPPSSVIEGNHVEPAPRRNGTNGAGEHRKRGPYQPRESTGRALLPFEEFDRLVRSEMARIAIDGIIPSFAGWDANRDPQLPTMTGVIRRYRLSTIGQLAEMMGLRTARDRA